MFESLTKYLPELDRAEGYGDWVVDRESKGTTDDPIQMPYMNYERVVIEVEQAIYAFVDERPEFELTRYSDILERNGSVGMGASCPRPTCLNSTARPLWLYSLKP